MNIWRRRIFCFFSFVCLFHWNTINSSLFFSHIYPYSSSEDISNEEKSDSGVWIFILLLLVVMVVAVVVVMVVVVVVVIKPLLELHWWIIRFFSIFFYLYHHCIIYYRDTNHHPIEKHLSNWFKNSIWYACVVTHQFLFVVVVVVVSLGSYHYQFDDNQIRIQINRR